MINWIIDQLFKWESLRIAIFSEVDWYNSTTRILQDPEEMRTARALWCEVDGWRGWAYDEDKNRYYFYDIPFKSLADALEDML